MYVHQMCSNLLLYSMYHLTTPQICLVSLCRGPHPQILNRRHKLNTDTTVKMLQAYKCVSILSSYYSLY